MTVLLDVIAPVFGILGLGYGAARLKVLDAPGIRGLVHFVFNFAIPVLLFRSMAGMELPEHIPWGFLAAFYSGALTTYGAGMALARWGFHRPLADQAIFGMAAGFSNTVLLGIPIVLTALGPEAALPLFLIIGFHSAILMPVTVALIHMGRGEGVSLAEQTVYVVREIGKNPIVMGLLLGLLANAGGVVLPGPVDRLAELLGGAAVPCALFAMGASLSGYPARGDVVPAAALAALKLLLHPLIVWVMVGPVLGMEGIWATTAVVMAAMPSGVNVYLFGARYDAAPSVAARAVLFASVCSVVTLSALLVLLN